MPLHVVASWLIRGCFMVPWWFLGGLPYLVNLGGAMASQRERKGTVNNSKWSPNKTNATQMEPQLDQKGANQSENCSKHMPWSV